MTVAFIQARMGSSRLPGKVLKPIADGQSLLEVMLKRVSLSKMVDEIVVVTSSLPQDGPIEQFCGSRGVKCFRGSEQDVLDRFYQAARQVSGVKHIVRLTADCVLHHGETIDQVINWYVDEKVDYFSNSNHEPDVLEDGFDVEVFSFDALETAAKNATLPSDREHVTPFIKNSGQFKCGWRKTNQDYKFKLSVDTEADFRLAREIIAHFHPSLTFTMTDVVRLLCDRPALLELNKESKINAGYKKSLENDLKRYE